MKFEVVYANIKASWFSRMAHRIYSEKSINSKNFHFWSLKIVVSASNARTHFEIKLLSHNWPYLETLKIDHILFCFSSGISTVLLLHLRHYIFFISNGLSLLFDKLNYNAISNVRKLIKQTEANLCPIFYHMNMTKWRCLLELHIYSFR